MTEPAAIVIVGGGHAAAQLCASLAAAGLGAQVHLVCEEPVLPYQRPPLSKAFLKSAQEAVQLHRTADWYADAGITVHLADAAVVLDRAAQTLQLRSGRTLRYTRLVLATGARARQLPHLQQLPEDLANLSLLRSAADAESLRGRLLAAEHVTVLGGGFIGLEIAAAARALGKAVQVLESAPRLLLRAVSPGLSAHVLQTHRHNGIDVQLGVAVGGFELAHGRVQALTVGGRRQAVDLLVLGIGAAPEQALAQAAGLACGNGIEVDECMRSSDPAILAVGDCCHFPRGGQRLRLESVPNANDQARTAVATLLGKTEPYAALPWFWSDQAGLRLQMAGLLPADAAPRRRPGAVPGSFSILHYAAGQLACVESVNAPLDHLAARKLLEAGKSPDVGIACDPAVPLKLHI